MAPTRIRITSQIFILTVIIKGCLEKGQETTPRCDERDLIIIHKLLQLVECGRWEGVFVCGRTLRDTVSTVKLLAVYLLFTDYEYKRAVYNKRRTTVCIRRCIDFIDHTAVFKYVFMDYIGVIKNASNSNKL